MVNNDNLCLKHGCHNCCDPVKIISANLLSVKSNPLFILNDEDWLPKSCGMMIRLNTFRCLNFNSKNGLCNDYDNRPIICRNTMCCAFEMEDYIKQREIIDGIKSEKYTIMPSPTPYLGCKTRLSPGFNQARNKLENS